MADYCFFKYFWEDEYEEKYQCLVSEGIPLNARYCQDKVRSSKDRALRSDKGHVDDYAEK